jgi:sugar (pentulose or hexulose) kinase
MRDNFLELARNFEGTGIGISEVRLTGGGARSLIWTQILADATGYMMRVPLEEECGCLGAALNAGLGVGLYSNHRDAVNKAVRIGREVTPSRENGKKYSRLFGTYKRSYEALWDEWDRLYETVVRMSG